jgi:hypothetical protein
MLGHGRRRRWGTKREIMNAYVADRVQREYLQKKRGYQAEIARATKTSTAHVSNVATGKAAVGDGFANAVAEKVWKIDYPEFARLADEWAKDREAEGWTALGATHPHFVAAVKYLLDRELLSEVADASTIEWGVMMARTSVVDLEERTWIDALEDHHRLRKARPSSAPQSRIRESGRDEGPEMADDTALLQVDEPPRKRAKKRRKAS